MKFSHLSDCHIGGWRDLKLRELGIQTFRKAIELSIEEKVGFILIAGDLFDTALPQIDLIKQVAAILAEAKEYDIPIYLIPGSHDFSTSGKTMLDVLEKAGLVENVMKLKDNSLEFTHDRTGTKIAGFLGRKGGLEKYDYEKIDYSSLEKETGFKIFLFHSLLNQLKGKEFEKVEGADLTILPKHFNYYAGGHPHFIKNVFFENYGLIAYPGPTFPNNFKELEELGYGGFYLVETNGQEIKPRHIQIKLKEVKSYLINAENKTILELEQEILDIQDYEDKIITLRIEGTLKQGKPSDLDFSKINKHFEKAYTFLRNTTKLTSQEEKQTFQSQKNNIEDIEQEIIQKNLSKKIENEEALINKLITSLDKEKQEGEKNQDFENRIIQNAFKDLNIQDV